MYEINKEKVVKLNVGNTVKTQEPVLFNVQNTLITGLSGSGVMKIVDNIIMNLTVDYSPEEVGIQYYSYDGFGIPWINPNRKLPHMINQTYYDVDRTCSHLNFYRHVCNCLASLVMMCENLEEAEEVMNKKRQNIIVLSIETEPTHEVQQAISTLMQFTQNHSYNVSVVAIVHNCNKLAQCLSDCADLRIATKVDDSTSKQLFGHVLNTRDIKGGFAWVMESNNPYLMQCVSIPYKPDTLCSKICKFLSNDKSYSDDKYSFVWCTVELDYLTGLQRALTYLTTFNKMCYDSENHRKITSLNIEEADELLVEYVTKKFSYRTIAPF